MNETEKGIATATAGEKLKIQGQLSEVAGYLIQVFGEKEASRMLRAAARMIAPAKAGK